MKLLLDENLEAAILRGLLRVRPGLDVVRVVDVGLAGAPDQAVLAWAAEGSRVVVSRDRATVNYPALKGGACGKPRARVDQGKRYPIRYVVWSAEDRR
jgi:predicted nuclease of predicted toxin-antitoxin system